MRKIFLKRTLCLFKKVSYDKEHTSRSVLRIALINAHAHARGVRLVRGRGCV